MSWLVLAFILATAVLAPLFGADTRDGRDWRTTPRNGYAPPEPSPAAPVRRRVHRVRTTGTRVRPSSSPVPAGAARRVQTGR
ncbi:hypothetical protein [Sphaerisporangium sp. TRM90804]|uniref:hypothetical protein n=1 Tax=Sphaerisporangium sp. TRM90804 TaxID=3031113 RepID=UPI002447587E|nr:hypothetical protein [Sphaerisporangium sp. TRM90804]MDH2427827.1 hypothetical protein [Sphaerisporangium sp. TRM90804]